MLFKKLFISSLIISSSLLLVNSLPIQAKNEVKLNQKNQSEIQKVLQNLKEKDPQKPISQKLKTVKNNESDIISEQNDNFQIKFSLKYKKIHLKNKDKGNISVGVPNSDSFDSVDVIDNKIIYSGQNSKTDVIIESVEGGFRQVINIKDATADDFYDFPVELAAGEKLELTENGGAIIIGKNPNYKSKTDVQDLPKEMDKKTLEMIKSNQIVKTTIGKPWAKDANGKDLKTSYSIENGNILRQKIDLKDAVFPVVADPTWCGNQIHSIQWQEWRNPVSLGVIPTYCGRFLAIDNWDAWSEMWWLTPYNYHWNYSEQQYGTSKYWSMYKQFLCHYDNPVAQIVEGEWNLEPSRPNYALSTFYANACNPN